MLAPLLVAPGNALDASLLSEVGAVTFYADDKGGLRREVASPDRRYPWLSLSGSGTR